MTTTTKASATTAKPSTTYAAAYAQLAAIAERLKGTGNAASIDTLAQDVAEARNLYASCKARLNAIRVEIDAELALDGEGGAS